MAYFRDIDLQHQIICTTNCSITNRLNPNYSNIFWKKYQLIYSFKQKNIQTHFLIFLKLLKLHQEICFFLLLNSFHCINSQLTTQSRNFTRKLLFNFLKVSEMTIFTLIEYPSQMKKIFYITNIHILKQFS